jgi:hypothetical protein
VVGEALYVLPSQVLQLGGADLQEHLLAGCLFVATEGRRLGAITRAVADTPVGGAREPRNRELAQDGRPCGDQHATPKIDSGILPPPGRRRIVDRAHAGRATSEVVPWASCSS